MRFDAHAPDGEPERRRFTTTPSDLQRFATWLREREVKEAVMESTAQYWRSVWLELEPYMRLQLAQAFSNRAPRGRKHGFKDAERLMRSDRRRVDLEFCSEGGTAYLAQHDPDEDAAHPGPSAFAESNGVSA